MNRGLVERWNRRVAPQDIVFYLGDFSLSKRAVTEFLPKLNGQKYLVAGNHDHCHPVHGKSKSARMEKFYLEAGFLGVTTEQMYRINGVHVKLHHMPYLTESAMTIEEARDGGKIRYPEYRPRPSGETFLLHGHVHCGWKKRGNMINVGCDVWNYYPVSQAEIAALMESHEQEA